MPPQNNLQTASKHCKFHNSPVVCAAQLQHQLGQVRKARGAALAKHARRQRQLEEEFFHHKLSMQNQLQQELQDLDSKVGEYTRILVFSI